MSFLHPIECLMLTVLDLIQCFDLPF